MHRDVETRHTWQSKSAPLAPLLQHGMWVHHMQIMLIPKAPLRPCLCCKHCHPQVLRHQTQ